MRNPILNYLRRNKAQCAKCGRWKDTRSNMLEPFVGDWCLACVWEQQSQALELIGIVLAIRAKNQDHWPDIADLADGLIRALPKKDENREALWASLSAAVNCEMDKL